MTDRPSAAVEEFEFALTERLQRFELTDEMLRDEFELPPDYPLVRLELLAIDTTRVTQIAWYLMDEEELADDFGNPDERDRVITIGMFIYGWEESKLIANDDDADD